MRSASPGSSRSRATAAVVHYAFERAVVHMQTRRPAAGAAPHRRPAGHRRRRERRQPRRGASPRSAPCPGQTSVAVARLGDGAPELIASIEPDRPLAIGSAFKLFILAELSRQVAAGERRWSDVVTLDRRSIPSGVLQGWPRGSPLTLHTLAALMISQSDNTRDRHAAPRRRPRECRADDGDDRRPGGGRATGPCCRRSSCPRSRPRPTPRVAALARRRRSRAPAPARHGLCSARRGPHRHRPLHRRPAPHRQRRMVRLARPIWCGRWTGSAATATTRRAPSWRSIPALGPPVTRRPRYVGFKGGSEPGVLNLTWLVRNRAGDLARRHRQLEQSGRARRGSAADRAAFAGDPACTLGL